MDAGLEAANPLDAWGTGIDADRIFRESFAAFHDDDDVAAMAFVVDLTRQGEPYDEGYLQVALDVWASTTKPFCVLSNLSAAVDRDEVRMLRADGIPVLEGTTSGLRSLKHLLDHATWRTRAEPTALQPAPEVAQRLQRDLLSATTTEGYVSVPNANVLFGSIGPRVDGTTIMTFTLAGIDYFNYKFRGKDSQINALLVGAFNTFTLTNPKTFGRKIDSTVQVLALAFNVTDLDAAVAKMEAKSTTITMTPG